TTAGLIRWLDDMDRVHIQLQGDEQEAWRQLLKQWSEQLLDILALQGVFEIQLLGKVFDPQWSESIGTVPSKANVGRTIDANANEDEDVDASESESEGDSVDVGASMDSR